MKFTFKKTILILLITYILLVAGNFIYKKLFGTEVVYLKINKVTELSGFNYFIRDILDESSYHYDLDFKILKSNTDKIDEIYLNSYTKPDNLYKANDLLCGYIEYVSPASVMDLLKSFFGKNIYSIHNVELVNNLSEEEINEMFNQKSKGFLMNNIYILLIFVALIVLGYFVNKKIKPTFKKQNDEIIFNRPEWLEISNSIISLTLCVFSLYLIYDSVMTASVFYGMVFFVLFIITIFILNNELQNKNDYLIISKNYLSIRDNKRFEKISFNEIKSASLMNDGLKIKTDNKEIVFNYSSMNLEGYSVQINENIKLVLADKIISEENK